MSEEEIKEYLQDVCDIMTHNLVSSGWTEIFDEKENS